MENSPKETYIKILPLELLQTILAFISHEDQRSNVRLASRWFFDIVGSHQFDIGLVFPSEMEQLARVFGRDQKPLGLTFNKPQKLSPEDMRHLSTLTQITLLHTEGDIKGSTLIPLTDLASLEVANVTTTTLQHLSKLTHLHARITSDATDSAKLSNLASLELITSSSEWPNITCHNVTCLTLEYHGGTDDLLSNAPTKTTNYQLPTTMCHSITSLSLYHVLIENKNDVLWHQLKSLSLDMPSRFMDISALHHIAKCTNLTSLNVHCLSRQDMVDAINVYELKQLQSFTLLIGGRPPFGSVKNILLQLNKDTLKTLQTIIWHDHQECITEISKMTELESLQLYVHHLSEQYETDDVSLLMTMTRLASLRLSTGRSKGLDKVTKLTDLHTLAVTYNNQDQTLDTLCLSALSNLTDLVVTDLVKVLDIRGATKLQCLTFNPPHKSESALEWSPDELGNLKEISIGVLSKLIPWIDLVKCTKLENINMDSFVDTDDSILVLQNLKRLTRLGHCDVYYNKAPCSHFNVDHLTRLSRLQRIELRVPLAVPLPKILPEWWPMMVHLKQDWCNTCTETKYLKEMHENGILK
eukprot:TRINITY_DN12834_c0_g1_i1.p1 TRINITY_DN12834_c0_g1~~TRINITY_DN12834_c0_g1_i1.p1  ORF type:complete len:584 (+),score=44.52 TRINITY_DN12834_c0_g1_i1:423-2174(+)